MSAFGFKSSLQFPTIAYNDQHVPTLLVPFPSPLFLQANISFPQSPSAFPARIN
jgi:hypothetical protein